MKGARMMISGTAMKYGSGDRAWREGTAMEYHYFTQPLPNGLTHLFYYMPQFMKRASVWAIHIIEGPLSLLMFGNPICRALGFASRLALLAMVNWGGNYGFFGILMLVQTVSFVDSQVWALIPYEFPYYIRHYLIVSSYPVGFVSWVWSYGAVMPYVLISLVPLYETFNDQVPWLEEAVEKLRELPTFARLLDRWAPVLLSLLRKNSPLDWWPWLLLQRAYHFIEPFGLINQYGHFGTRTLSTWRGEIIIEGSNDGTSWFEYQFKYKVGDINAYPSTIPGHFPALDWAMWSLPQSALRKGVHGLPDWYFSFLEALLQGREPVLRLLGSVPSHPPTFIRSSLYDYRIPKHRFRSASREEQAWAVDRDVEHGLYWSRKLLFPIHKPLTLSMFEASLRTGNLSPVS